MKAGVYPSKMATMAARQPESLSARGLLQQPAWFRFPVARIDFGAREGKAVIIEFKTVPMKSLLPFSGDGSRL